MTFSGCKLTELKEKTSPDLKNLSFWSVQSPIFFEVRNLPTLGPCHWRKWFESLAGIHASVEADDICFQLLQPFDQRPNCLYGILGHQKVGGRQPAPLKIWHFYLFLALGVALSNPSSGRYHRGTTPELPVLKDTSKLLAILQPATRMRNKNWCLPDFEDVGYY